MKQHRLRIKGPAGAIETVLDLPAGPPRGVALIAHPHPLHGGSLDNKVVATLAKAALAGGEVAVRANFRGVGATAGEYDAGIGETEDLLTVAQAVQAAFPDLPWRLLGFSFGAFVQHRVAARWPARQLILVGPALGRFDFAPPPIPAAIVHGADDELIPLAQVADYARAHAIPLRVIPGASHFFHGKLMELKTAVAEMCCG